MSMQVLSRGVRSGERARSERCKSQRTAGLLGATLQTEHREGLRRGLPALEREVNIDLRHSFGRFPI
jgi:hypothetical protein